VFVVLSKPVVDKLPRSHILAVFTGKILFEYYRASFSALESYQVQELPNLQGYELLQHFSYINSSVPIRIREADIEGFLHYTD